MPLKVEFRGLDITRPINRIRAGFAALCANVRTYLRETVLLRNQLSISLLNLSGTVQTITRLNDTTPNGPSAGFALIISDTLGNLYVNGTIVATGLSGNPISVVIFRPNASVEPWAYVFDSSESVTIHTTNLLTGLATTFNCFGMVKVNANGLIYKTGIQEPQYPPIVGINTTSVTQWLSLPAITPPWTNIGGQNPSQNYSGTDPQPPFPATISTPIAGATVTLTVTGTATVNGSTHSPGDSGPTTTGYPGAFIASAQIVVFAFTDANGNIIAQSTAVGAPPVLGNVGAGATLTVPAGAAQLQLGIDSQGGHFSANSGSFLVEAVVSTSAIVQVTSLVGLVTASVWGDSPHSGPVAEYIWKNPNDAGTGISRAVGTASVSATNNSLIFDSTPEDGTVPVQWSTLNSAGSTIGTIPLFSPALESQGFQDFNCTITGSIFFPSGGTFAVQIQNKDQIMFGMGGGITAPSQPVFGSQGQAITVASGLPLLYVSTPNGGGGAVTNTFNIQVPALGVYSFEVDWDYWFHSGRSLIIEIAPTAGGSVALLPPLPQGTRTQVSYACKPRSSLTGAVGNPSPTSTPQLTPVLANTVQGAFVNDPQADKMDYYRQDSALANYTYVATGPNDGLGGTVNGVVYNSQIVDELSDLAAAANPIMSTDDFEPVPSIDTPKSGKVTIVDGVITWVSGDKFNPRWLPGTIILIGQPTTQLAYTLFQRPLSTTTMVIPEVNDTIGDMAGDGVPYNIAEPILANQPIPFVFGPTDNVNFAYGVGDPLRAGTEYWSKGNNLDSWPDTNQDDVTDPSEALVNGAMSSGLAILFSIKRAWVTLINSSNATATAQGTVGTPWTWTATAINRGLYMPWCLWVQGGGNVYYRVFDGIQVSARGQAGKSITDETLYPIFPHEGSTPTAVTRNGITIFPPDDTKPQFQKFRGVGQFLYYDYVGIDANYHTLTYDTDGGGWAPDFYTPPVTAHAASTAQSLTGVYAGCSDGTVRNLLSTGTIETPTASLVSPAIGGQGFGHFGQLTIEYSSNGPISLLPIAIDTGNGSYYGGNAITLPATGGVTAKLKLNPAPNKAKLVQFQFTWTDPTAQIYLPGFIVSWANWEGTYRPIAPFTEAGGEGGQL